MGRFERGLAGFAELAAQLADQVPAHPAAPLEREFLAGATFLPGDQVTDLVSGQGGIVVDSNFVNTPVPVAGSERS